MGVRDELGDPGGTFFEFLEFLEFFEFLDFLADISDYSLGVEGVWRSWGGSLYSLSIYTCDMNGMFIIHYILIRIHICIYVTRLPYS